LGYIDLNIPLIPIFVSFLYIGSFAPKVQTNEWPKIARRRAKMSTGSARRHKASARRKRPPPLGARQALARRHCWAVDRSFAHCLLASAWRWEASAKRQFSLMWQVSSFSSVFARGNVSLAFWRHEEHILQSLEEC